VKVVLDSNVLLAGFTSRGLCESVVIACLDSQDLVGSHYILGELERNLTTKFKMPDVQATQIVRFLTRSTTVVEPTPVRPGACADKTDLPILGTAVAGTADCLVSGDQDLLMLKKFKGIAILSPRAFYDRLV
jgi:uncharacterized protein